MERSVGKTKVIGVDSIKRNFVLGGRERSLSVPNYEAELKKLLKTSSGLLRIHGVRLPTLEDMAKESHPEHKFSIEVCYVSTYFTSYVY